MRGEIARPADGLTTSHRSKGETEMTLADYSVLAFALMNAARIVAYFPQMIRIYRDTDGAQAVSLSTWILFAATNVATVCYALAALNDHIVALVFALNTVCCLAIAGMTASKRAQWLAPNAMDALDAKLKGCRRAGMPEMT